MVLDPQEGRDSDGARRCRARSDVPSRVLLQRQGKLRLSVIPQRCALRRNWSMWTIPQIHTEHVRCSLAAWRHAIALEHAQSAHILLQEELLAGPLEEEEAAAKPRKRSIGSRSWE